MATKMLNVRLPADVAELLDSTASESGETISEFVRKLIDDALFPSKGSHTATVEDDDDGDTKVDLDTFNEVIERSEKQNKELADRLDEHDKVTTGLTEKFDNLWGIMRRMAEMNDEHKKVCDEKLGKLHTCPDCGASLHRQGLDNGAWRLECPLCGYFSANYKATVWKEKAGKHPIPVKETTAKIPPAENKPKPESEIFMGKREGDGWTFYEALGFSVKEPAPEAKK